MRLFILSAFALLTAGCAFFASEPQFQVDEVRQAYNTSLELLIKGRSPCVDIGPDAPSCIINDDLYQLLEPIRKTAFDCIESADIAIASGNEDKAKVYIECAFGASRSLTEIILTEGNVTNG